MLNTETEKAEWSKMCGCW